MCPPCRHLYVWEKNTSDNRHSPSRIAHFPATAANDTIVLVVELVSEARRRNLDGISITDHARTRWDLHIICGRKNS